MFDQIDYSHLHELCFSDAKPYPGYRRGVVEYPNGDRNAGTYRYAHVALKYLPSWGSAYERNTLMGYLVEAHRQAEAVADALDCPDAYRPDLRYGALRVLEYEPGAFSPMHTDASLFTLHLYRNSFDAFRKDPATPVQSERALAINPGLHIGRLGEIVGLGQATPHWTVPTTERQLAIVYFAIPDWAAALPGSAAANVPNPPRRETVGAWIDRTVAAMRAPKGEPK